MFFQERSDGDVDRPIAGQLRDSKTQEPLPGHRVSIESDAGEPARVVGTAFSQLDGVFAIPLSSETLEGLARGGGRVTVSVKNRFGRVVHSAVVSGHRLYEPLEILIERRDDLDHPSEPVRADPFRVFRAAFEPEVAALEKGGVRSLDRLMALDLAAFSRRYELSLSRLSAFRLAAYVNAPHLLSGDDARALVAAGFTSADDVALAAPAAIYRAVRRYDGEAATQRPAVSATRVLEWQMAARGWQASILTGHIESAVLTATFEPVGHQLVTMNPRATLVTHFESIFLSRLSAIAEMRAIMEAGGVHDLSGLGTFRVKGTYRIGPGYHIAPPRSILSKVSAVGHMQRLIAQGGAFSKVASINFANGHLHIAPNPVREAVILGSVVQFLENGALIVAKEVSKLIVVTEEIKYGVINLIDYEGHNEVPTTPAKLFGRAQVTRSDGILNAANVYTKGQGDDGRDGLNGPPGMEGSQGRTSEDAPSVSVFVKSVPAGLPNVNLNGRRGGRGQDGQDGGNGEPGARGRESCSSALWCVTDVGNGGRGGDGGAGGKGGKGGSGGGAGTIKIFTTPDSLPRLLSRPGVFIGHTGGDAGDGGDGGAPGDKGAGGWVGNDTGWCDADDGHGGADGAMGQVGQRGDLGGVGRHGAFEVQPITEDDWNAAFTFPFLSRLEPAIGAAGQNVHMVGLNFTSMTRVTFDGQLVTPTGVDIARNTLNFTIPPGASGGVHVVALSVPVPSNPVLRELSNALNFRVQPRISSVQPARVLPGAIIQLQGSGFSTSADVRVDGKTFLLVVTGPMQASLKLPDFDTIDLTAGIKTVAVINSDGEVSNTQTFELETVIVVKVKAWRVLDDDDDGTGRDDDDIREIFNHEFSPASIWDDHGIQLEFDPNIGVARVSSDLASTWPASDDANADAAAKGLVTPTAGGDSFFVPGAINVYFVNDIDDATAHAYTRVGLADTVNPPPWVIFEDTGWLSVEDEAHVAAHEIGHVFGLHHVCAKNEDEDAATTDFGRVCSENSDKDWLMYPKTNKWTNEGNALTASEVKRAKSFARNLHRKAP